MGELSFVQISDSHMASTSRPTLTFAGTLEAAVGQDQ